MPFIGATRNPEQTSKSTKKSFSRRNVFRRRALLLQSPAAPLGSSIEYFVRSFSRWSSSASSIKRSISFG